jgi:hypothetical protein
MVSHGTRKEQQHFYITNLGKDRFIFGFPWCQAFKPDIDWTEAQIKGPRVQIETLLLGKYQRIKNYIKEKKAADQEQEDIILELNCTECPPWSGATPEEIQRGQVEINQAYNAVEMAHKYTLEHGTEEITLPEEFKHHAALFSDEEANKFPPL